MRYFEHTWPGQFDLLTRQQVLDSKACSVAELLIVTLPIVLAISLPSRGNTYLWWVNKTNVMLGRTASLHPG